jgi:predicted nucleic acid-binding protein
LIVAFDASILIYVIDEQAKPPIDSATGKPVDRCHERVRRLLESLQQNAKIVIPTPTLAEVLVRAVKGGPELLRILSSSKHFCLASFDERAAAEFAARQAERIAAGERAPAARREGQIRRPDRRDSCRRRREDDPSPIRVTAQDSSARSSTPPIATSMTRSIILDQPPSLGKPVTKASDQPAVGPSVAPATPTAAAPTAP